MNHLRKTKSHIWSFSFLKPRHKSDSDHPKTPQASRSDHKSVSPDVWVDATEDQRDGFYRYSELHEESLEGPLAEMKQNDMLDENSEYFLDSSFKPHSRPYRVSSGEWVTAVTSSSPSPSPTYGASRVTSQVLSLDDLTNIEIATHFAVVLKIFSQIYAIAKLAQIAFMGYGIELDNSETGLKYWIDRAEANIGTVSLGELITIVEHLFYVVYARIKLEMAGIELCALYKMESRPAMTKDRPFYMPEPNHLYRIFLLFKDILDSPRICEERDNNLISRFMENYVRLLICKDARLGPFVIDDILGYRRYAYSIVNNRHSTYCKKWDSLISIFPDFPPETMTVLSERYFTMTPKQVPDCDIPVNELPFTNLELIDPVLREREIILDHRIGTLAKLEGKCIGDCRRENDKIRLLHEVKHSKCICKSACFCARKCTYDVERRCPCAERQLRMQLAIHRKRTGDFEFVTRVNTVILAGFQGLAALKEDAREDAIAGGIVEIFEVLLMEIHKERLISDVASWV
ncbi:hypothetical protein N7507_010583 [Penicillium longicatenatum]|nr:hypothetical protein N7507_010583 [Penicillium longicatenatum]